MSRRSELRAAVQERSRGICEWSRCSTRGEQLAHLRGLGMGGNPDLTRDVEANVMFLCVYHHDILDGRSVKGRRFEVTELLRAYLRKENQ